MIREEIQKQDAAIRRLFPLIEGHPEIAYLDNAATMQKPLCVIEREREYYLSENANPLRGLYALSQTATEVYEDAREAVRAFLNAKSREEIIFTRNATESLNLVARSWCEACLRPDDEILVTIMEHHSNFLPWLQAAKRAGASLRILECDKDGRISEESFRRALTERTRLVAMTQISNVLGTENDIRLFAAIAHEHGAVFVCDGAQSVPHIPVDVQALDVDFLAFSGHKMGAPMGIGVLYGKKKWLKKMPPFLYGGEMIEYVTREGATWAELPHKFEAGTVNAGGAAGLAEAIRFYERIGFDTILERERRLGEAVFRALTSQTHVRLLGAPDADSHHGIFTFTVEGVHPHDIAAILDADGVDIRAGHHCAQPLMEYLQEHCRMEFRATARASVYFYNTEEEAERFVEAMGKIRKWLGF